MERPPLMEWVTHDGSREAPFPNAIVETAPLNAPIKVLGGDWSRVTHYRVISYGDSDAGN